jgi:hypothetical protein
MDLVRTTKGWSFLEGICPMCAIVRESATKWEGHKSHHLQILPEEVFASDMGIQTAQPLASRNHISIPISTLPRSRRCNDVMPRGDLSAKGAPDDSFRS